MIVTIKAEERARLAKAKAKAKENTLLTIWPLVCEIIIIALALNVVKWTTGQYICIVSASVLGFFVCLGILIACLRKFRRLKKELKTLDEEMLAKSTSP